MQPIAWNPDWQHPPAFAGMLADSMVTDKVTVPCGAAPQPFGTVVASVPASGVSALPIGANSVEGIAIHEHGTGSRMNAAQQGAYVQYDAMSVLRRGRIWAKASGACTKDAVAKYDPATGQLADAGTGTLANAKFLTTALTVPDILGGGSQMIVQVELHSPAV